MTCLSGFVSSRRSQNCDIFDIRDLPLGSTNRFYIVSEILRAKIIQSRELC